MIPHIAITADRHGQGREGAVQHLRGRPNDRATPLL